MAAEYLWAVQDTGGRELISWRSNEVGKVGDVSVARVDGKVRLMHSETVMGEVDDPGTELNLHRWKVDEGNPSVWKTKAPVSAAVVSAP